MTSIGAAGSAGGDPVARRVDTSHALKVGLVVSAAAVSLKRVGEVAGARATAIVRYVGSEGVGTTAGARGEMSTHRGAGLHPLAAELREAFTVLVCTCAMWAGCDAASAASLLPPYSPTLSSFPSSSLHPRPRCTRSSGARDVILRGGGGIGWLG